MGLKDLADVYFIARTKMIEIHGDLWDYYDRGFICCITTNGYVKKDRRAVMGRGTAKQALERFPDIDLELGFLIKTLNPLYVLWLPYPSPQNRRLLAFPVKPDRGVCRPSKKNVVFHMRNKFRPGQTVPGWALIADLQVIKNSLDQLNTIYNWDKPKAIILPRPDCGVGGLNWESQVKPLCEEYGDWLWVIDREKKG